MKQTRKSIKLLPILLGLAILLTSCNSDSATKRDESTLNVWMYNHWTGRDDSERESLETYVEENNIELQLTEYDGETLAYEDYILKRNIAINNGEVDVVFDNYYGFEDMNHLASDYSQMDIASELSVDLDNITAVPLYYRVPLVLFNNSLLEHYDVKLQDMENIRDYYELKDELKSKGCTFELNYVEFPQIVQHHLLQNDIVNQFKNQEASLRENLGNTIAEIFDEIDRYEQKLAYVESSREIYDLKTQENLYELMGMVDAEKLSRNTQLENQTPICMRELDYSAYYNRYDNKGYSADLSSAFYIFIPNNASKHGEGFFNYIFSSEPQARLLSYPYLDSRTPGLLPINQSPETLKMINLNEDYSMMYPLGYNNADKIDKVREMGYKYMQEKGFDLVTRDSYDEQFVENEINALVRDALENGYDDNKMQRDLDKLVSDYKLYYTKGQ